MHVLLKFLMAFVWLLGVGACAGPLIQDKPLTLIDLGRTTHRGFEDCLRIQARTTELIIVPQWAGRISRLDFGSGNVLHTDPTINGKTLPIDQAWMRWDGNATDLVRSDGRNQWPGLWLHPWLDVQVTDGRIVRISSAEAADARVQATRTYRLKADGRTLRYTYAIKNPGDHEQAWTIWERAVVPADGYVLAPVNRGHPPWAEGWKPRGQATAEALVGHVQRRGDLLVLRGGMSKGAGIAARLAEGWIAHVTDQGVFVISYPLDADGHYPHDDGANAVFWLAGNFIELEPLSPQVSLKPGQKYTFEQRWHWLGDAPAKISGDLQRLAQWIGDQLGRAEAQSQPQALRREHEQL
jgi:hypothetical protein